MQVVITRADSSVQVNYGPFSGTVLSFPPIQAWRIFQYNSALGLCNHSRTEGTAVLYRNTWYAVNGTCRSCNKNFRQQGQWALKYKQWKNVVRAVSVDFPTRNYEICLGQSVKPKATYMNVDTVTRTFKAKFQLRNVVTGVAVYGRVVNVTGLPQVPKQDTTFALYVTNPNVTTQLGTFKACAVATSYDPSDQWLGDRWPFDDTVCLRVYGIRTTNLPFNESNNEYSPTADGEIPNQRQWVAIGAQVVDGEFATYDPPPPKDDPLLGVGIGPSGMKAPVVKLDRVDINGNLYSGGNVGDTLVSFPFNLYGQSKVKLAFSYMRTGRTTFPMWWDVQTLIGPEHTIVNINNQVVRVGDSLKLEFKKPNEPACNPSSTGWNRALAVDGGNDFEYKKVSVDLQSSLPITNYLVNNFRFRLRLAANDNGFNPPDDDGDEWFVDNISLQVPRKPEIEVMWVRVVTPYTKMPATQAVSMPIAVHLANNSTDVAVSFPVRVQVLDPSNNTVYWAIQTVTNLRGGTDTTIFMPNWNAQNAGSAGNFYVHAWIAQSGYDSYTDDNGTYTQFFLDINPPGAPDPQEFAYDDNSNDWPGRTLINGEGIGFNGTSSGSFAMKFRMIATDTLYGARVYFGNANQSPDAIRISLLKGTTACAPTGDTVGTGMMEDVRRGQLFNQFWPYYFEKPIVIAGGKNSPTGGYYWMSVSQLSLDNYMLGADESRGGGRVRVYDPISPAIEAVYGPHQGDVLAPQGLRTYGTLWGQYNSTGDVSCAFALEQGASTGTWGVLMPANGWWPQNSAASGGWRLAWGIGPAAYYAYGTPNPMIRVMVSKQDFLPVELLYLKGREDNGKALLTWATAQEKNNQGFYVERRNVLNKDDFFSKVGFVAGKGNSSVSTGYSYQDRNVTPGTYDYRLVQVDLDGAEKTSNMVEVGIGTPSNYSLEQNYPNPFEPSVGTDITYTLPEGGDTRLVIYNTLGQQVRTLVGTYVDAGTHKVAFNGKDDAGTELASGNYFYKLTSGSYAETRKLTITK
jgi:hypothetical protein